VTKHILVLTTVTFALIFGAIGAKAQEDSDDSAMTMQQNSGDEDDSGVMGHGTMRRHERAQDLPRATGRGENRNQIRRLGRRPRFPRTRQSPVAGPVGPLDTPSLRTRNRRGGTTPILFFGRLKRRCRW
jgi:hypothetical protein